VKIKPLKILLVFGTRPAAIKMAPVVKALKNSGKFKVVVCVSAQHRQMLDSVLEVFEIQPDYDLNIMKPGQDLFDITTEVLLKIKPVLLQEKPDCVLVQGDTSTAISASLSAFYLKIPVGHIEAGLRTYRHDSPWPEELNRQIVGRIAQYHFAPTVLSEKNLLSENLNFKNILITGNTVIDALLQVCERLDQDKIFAEKTRLELLKNFPLSAQIGPASLSCLSREGRDDKQGARKYILITGHRRENFGQGFLNICEALKYLAQKYKDFDFIYPVHLNPNVQEPVFKLLGDLKNIILIPPLDYAPFIDLMRHCYLVMTDSGGIQEEAPSLGKPVIVLRDTTERPEAIDAGTVKLAGTSFENMVSYVSELIDNPELYQTMSRAINPYGDGYAAERITNYLSEQLCLSPVPVSQENSPENCPQSVL